MVHPGEALADAVLHQTGQAGQHVDGRIDGLPVHLAVQHDLPLGDIPGQVGDGMGNVVVGHGQNGNLRHAARPSGHDARSLVNGCQVAV